MVKGPKKLDLQSAIKQAFDKAKRNGSQANANSDAIIEQLAKDIAEAVHAYSTSLQITVTVPPTAVTNGVITVATQATG